MPTPAVVPWQPTKAAHLICLALAQVGKQYVYGIEGQPDLLLDSWDCSEYVQHMLAIAGVDAVTDDSDPPLVTPIGNFDGAGFQYERCHHIGLTQAIETPGALLFVQSASLYHGKPHDIGHVAISLGVHAGTGFLVEARGKAYGVVVSPVRGSFTLAGKVRELYTPAVVSV